MRNVFVKESQRTTIRKGNSAKEVKNKVSTWAKTKMNKRGVGRGGACRFPRATGDPRDSFGAAAAAATARASAKGGTEAKVLSS